MPYTQPDLSEILANEQTLNTNLLTAQTRLRAILDKEEIGYNQGDGVIPLIRKLPVLFQPLSNGTVMVAG